MISYNPDFQKMWEECRLDQESFKLKMLDTVCREIKENKARYLNVVLSGSIYDAPWGILASLHFREASLNFSRNMVNGQPLNQKTTLVPVGVGPFPSWESGAAFALWYKQSLFKDCKTQSDWLQACERYNGMGYRRRGLNSPYVWAFTDQSDERGLYKERTFFGKAMSWFDSGALNTRPGVAAIMRSLEAAGAEPWTN